MSTAPPVRRAARARSWALHAGVVAGSAAVSTGAAFYGIVAAVERVRPYREDWQPSRADYATDGAFLASVLAVQGAAMAVVGPVRHRTRRTLGVDRLPVPVGAAIGVLAFDLFHSRMHQIGHRWGPAWRVHSVHHSAERLYWFNATRFQATEMFLDMVMETVVVGLLGMSRDQHVVYQALRGMYGQVQHCNVDVDSGGVLNRVCSTPDLHRWHHSTVYAEGDTNYGALTSVWDQLFGTHFDPADREGPDAIGVGRMPDFPTTFWELERVPADWNRIKERNAATWYTDDGPADVPAEV